MDKYSVVNFLDAYSIRKDGKWWLRHIRHRNDADKLVKELNNQAVEIETQKHIIKNCRETLNKSFDKLRTVLDSDCVAGENIDDCVVRKVEKQAAEIERLKKALMKYEVQELNAKKANQLIYRSPRLYDVVAAHLDHEALAVNESHKIVLSQYGLDKLEEWQFDFEAEFYEHHNDAKEMGLITDEKRPQLTAKGVHWIERVTANTPRVNLNTDLIDHSPPTADELAEAERIARELGDNS